MKVKYITGLLLLGVIINMLVAFTVFADAVTDVETEKKSEQVKAPTKPQKKSKQLLPEFVPSEEVSIDKPVAFPVDI